MKKRVVVVGGGIAGLATAFHLQEGGGRVPGGLEVRVLEASPEPGGNIRTRREEGFIIERGPNGYLDNAPATNALVRRLGLEDRVQKADPAAAKRYLFRRGRLHRLPSGPLSFLVSPVLSFRGRLRVLAEPFAPRKPEGVDETVFGFAARRIGQEAASVLVDAMVSGVFAGNVHELSLASAFPKMAAMEEEHGSLVKAMFALAKERRRARKEAEARRARGEPVEDAGPSGGPAGPGGTLTSFREGLDLLPKTLAAALGNALRCGVEVVEVEWVGGGEGVGEGEGGGGSGGTDEEEGYLWKVRLASGETLPAHAVVLAVPAPKAVPLVAGLDPELAEVLGEIPTAPLAVVALAFDEGAMGGAPDGFGFLAPRGEGLRLLGCLWDSSIFPGRAPPGKVLLRAMIGGAHDPDVLSLTDQQIVATVLEDLQWAMGLRARPLWERVYRWRLGIAQYTVGHGARLARIHALLARKPGIWVAGSSYYGISMNACMEKAPSQAQEILAFLGGARKGGRQA